MIVPENVKADGRTTVMIKNIPNKYTLQALMEKIDENHAKTYDFFYLPIDFRVKKEKKYSFYKIRYFIRHLFKLLILLSFFWIE